MDTIKDADKYFLDKYKPVPFKLDANQSTTGSTNSLQQTLSSNLDRYEKCFIVANTTNPQAIRQLRFDNKSLINNSCKLFWFDPPKYNQPLHYQSFDRFFDLDGNRYNYNFDLFEHNQFAYKNEKNDIDKYCYGDGDIITYNEFKKDFNLYSLNSLYIIISYKKYSFIILY